MRKNNRNKLQWGEKGTKLVQWLGKLPSPRVGPFCTTKHYQFRGNKNPRLVDARDLPGLAKELGRKKLRDVEEYERKQAEKAQRKAEQEKAQASEESQVENE